jgi:Caspase domain
LFLVASEDHSERDCVVVAVMSHGDDGILYAKDQQYKPERLWSYFTSDQCPTLAGKPKIFFIQVSVNNVPDMNSCLIYLICCVGLSG